MALARKRRGFFIFMPFLSHRQRAILEMAAQGQSDKEMARRLELSVRTIRGHLRDARLRLNAANRTHAVALALAGGHITPPLTIPGKRPQERAQLIWGPDHRTPMTPPPGLWLKLRNFGTHYRLVWVFDGEIWLAREDTTRYGNRYGAGGAVAALQSLAERVGANFSDELV